MRRGEKALTLCMPVTVKRKATDNTNSSEEGERTSEVEVFTRFIYKARWFVLSQTVGEDPPSSEIPVWNRHLALRGLEIDEVPFDHPDGNCLGLARRRAIAVNPVNPLPHKTRFHELAHVLLGHTADQEQTETATLSRNQRELEAECVALLCCAALDLPGVAECRGYVQSWWGQGNPIPERSAQRILKTADEILRAGRAS